MLPFGVFEVDKSISVSVNGSKPGIEDAVKLWADVARVEVQDERCRRGVLAGETEEDGATRARFPARKFLAILHGGVEDVHGRPPNL
jgi:hypothetical protein